MLAETLNQPCLARHHTHPDQRAQRWLDQATTMGSSRPLLLAIGQQVEALGQLLRARTLLNGAIGRLTAPPGAPP